MDEALEWGARLLSNRIKNMNDVVMFDIDDTIIDSNSGEPMWNVIELYKFAKRRNYIIIIITARPHDDDNVRITKEQLNTIGIETDALIFARAEDKGTVKKYLIQYNFFLSIGDQLTDLTHTKHYIKLPDKIDTKVYYN